MRTNNKKMSFRVLACTFAFCLLPFAFSFAEGANKLSVLSKRVIEANSCDDAIVPLEELEGLYFNEAKFSDFASLLKSLLAKKKECGQCINYYLALTRYSQLKYLEEKQLWDEYFSKGNDYREELSGAAEKVIAAAGDSDPYKVYAGLILWQFHNDQQDAFLGEALEGLSASIKAYAAGAEDAKPIKDAADKLLSCGEKARAREFYRIYAQKIIASASREEELINAASNFYKEGNLELAENIYDAYMDKFAKLQPKDKLASLLKDIAESFVYKTKGASDPLYAEKIYSRLEELSGKEIFTEELSYKRALNLEKAKEYGPAARLYLELLERFPQSPHASQVQFKLGVINVYVLRELQGGKAYFDKLAQEESAGPYRICALYQLGILSQWQEDKDIAKAHYDKLLEIAGDNFAESKLLVRERVKEIEEGKPLEYNLKIFLDLSLKSENPLSNMSKVELVTLPSEAASNEEINISSSSYLPQSGCLQVEIEYLWSGNTGTKTPSNNEGAFNTTFSEPGTKVIGLVAVSTSGITDRSLAIVDIY
jgi:hypothetical protein